MPARKSAPAGDSGRTEPCGSASARDRICLNLTPEHRIESNSLFLPIERLEEKMSINALTRSKARDSVPHSKRTSHALRIVHSCDAIPRKSTQSRQERFLQLSVILHSPEQHDTDTKFFIARRKH
jgi:hypothetical protein